MLNKVMRAICGTVKFSATNGFSERLINLCACNNLSFSEIEKTQEGFTAIVASYDIKKVLELAIKVNVEIEIITKKGFWFKATKFKGRYGIIAGIIIFIVALNISKCYIWDITVQGNEKVPTKEILSELEDLGIKIGVKIDGIDFLEKKQRALLMLPDLAWITLNQLGSRVEVIVSERHAPPIIRGNTPCDIIAKKDGQICYMRVYNGEQIAQEGYPVAKGDLLVKGEFVDKENIPSLQHADAKVIARVQFDKTFTIDLSQVSKKYNGEIKKRNYIEIFGTEIPLFIATNLKGNYDTKKVSNPMKIFSLELPINLVTYKYDFYDKISDNLSKEQAEKILTESFKQYEIIELNNSAIIKRNIKKNLEGHMFSITTSYTVEEDIAQKSPIVEDLSEKLPITE